MGIHSKGAAEDVKRFLDTAVANSKRPDYRLLSLMASKKRKQKKEKSARKIYAL